MITFSEAKEKFRMTNYSDDFIREILDNSKSKEWKSAVLEWEIVGCFEDKKQQESCICGKERLRYLYEIKNKKTGQIIFPIGSSCIKKFDRHELDEDVDIFKQIANLLTKFSKNKTVQLNSENFSKKLFTFIMQRGAFKPNQYNGYNASSDYKFMIDMFNKRTELTENQRKKVNAILYFTIRPFLEKNFKINIETKKAEIKSETEKSQSQIQEKVPLKRKPTRQNDDLER